MLNSPMGIKPSQYGHWPNKASIISHEVPVGGY
jgi:hypothetical protein